jgi:hypothetical protein
MKNILVAVAILLSLNVHAQLTTSPGSRPASQTEVNAGVLHKVYVAPDTLAAALVGVSGPTNGVSSTVVSNIVAQNNAASATAGSAGMTNQWRSDAQGIAKTNQTPWIKNIDGANFDLTNVHGQSFVDNATVSLPGISTLSMASGSLFASSATLGGEIVAVDLQLSSDGTIIQDQDGLGLSIYDSNVPDFWFGSTFFGAEGRIHATDFYGGGSHLHAISTNTIDSTFYTFIKNSGAASSQTPWVSDIDGGGHSLTNVQSIGMNGASSNVVVVADAGGSISLSNGLTGANLVVPPTGPVTAVNGFDIGTNTGSVIINGNVTVSNSIVVVASYIPTNSTPSHIIYIGETDITTNGAVVYTGIDRILAGMYNYGVQHIHNTGGSVNAITPATPWHINGTWNVTNGGSSIVSVYVGPRDSSGGIETNAICYPQY